MHYIPQILFLIFTVFAIGFFSKNMNIIRRNILLGKEKDISGRKGERWRNVLLLAFGQKKMFRYPLVALLHFVVYAGFIIINIEMLEIVLDGIAGTHRMFREPLGGFYVFLINFFEILAVLVIVSCAVFLIRRNVIKLKRFISHDLDGWPRSDANYILITEIVLMSLFLIMNSADATLHDKGQYLISGYIAPLFTGESAYAIEKTAWWLHIVGVLAFLNYLPYSKHLHIILAFPNAYYGKLQPLTEMDNMPSVQNEVLYMMQPELAPAGDAAPVKFGAKDVQDLSWKNLLDAYSCTECGRCSAACPATQTGKLLSPRKIVMDTRDRLTEVGKNISKNGSFADDGKTLLHDYITTEELWACTTCNACVKECPVSISPLDIILELRRSLIMEESNAPVEWNAMFSNIENNFAPWKLSPDDRDAWVNG